MKAISAAVRLRNFAVLGALAVASCTSSGPDSLARSEESAAASQPPVTTFPLGTVAIPPSTAATTTSTQVGSEATDDLPETSLAEPVGIEQIESLLVPRLGPTANLALTVSEVASFPAAIPTPADAVITEFSIGLGTPGDDGTVLAQVGVTVTSSDSDSYDLMVSRVRAAGMFAIDSSESESTRSASFRRRGGDQFDEVIISAIDISEGSSVRIVSTAAVQTNEAAPFIDWAGSTLPLPNGGLQRTLIVASTTGEERLKSVTLTIESTVILDGASAQREANRLVDRAATSADFGVDADLEVDQALTGPLKFADLDQLNYQIVPVTRTVVDSEGELEEVESLEIRLTGEKRL